MPSMKISLLALASTVAAVPHYGAHSSAHNRYHSSRVAHGEKPYPTGGWPGSYNGTVVPMPTGNSPSQHDSTMDVTSTSTTTLMKTVTVKPSETDKPADVADVPSAGEKGPGGDSDKCGPATITVTASEKVTVTVTPGGGAGAPQSSSKGDGYGVPPVVSSTAQAEKPKPSPVVPVVPEMPHTTKAPEQPSEAPETPEPEAPVSKPAEYPASSAMEKPIPSEVVSSAAPSKTPEAPSTGAPTYSGTKRGLAYNQAHLCKAFGSKFGFGYNWAQTEKDDIGAPFIPMMHKPSDSTAADWLSNVEKAVGKGSTAVMGFNEPDHPAQAHLSPGEACSAWMEYMNPIAEKHPEVTILGPSVTNGPAEKNMGLTWLSKFHAQCPGAIVHATNIHFYDIYEEATIDRFIAQVEKAYDEYKKPVWVTEFGLNSGSATPEQATKFLNAAMKYLDGTDKCAGYSWFMVGSGEYQLNEGDGLSALGDAYASM